MQLLAVSKVELSFELYVNLWVTYWIKVRSGYMHFFYEAGKYKQV